ncbi:hypothetical protein [Domibacillus indicus]|uniref:hypothetical protein n=1 Tax=Domibacillus indicus TaxID=1437523 RepID=UPI000617EDF0|nr:hypothetical protein [Domibacillus indicus]
MHHGYPKAGDSIDAFIAVCGQPSPDSTDNMILFDIPGVNARLTCWIDEERIVHKLSSSMPMDVQAAAAIAERFLPADAVPAGAYLDTESSKLNTVVQTYDLEQHGQNKQAVITADETGSFMVSIAE